jgi:hypothetical protein
VKLRRAPLALPYPEEVPALAALVRGVDVAVPPDAARFARAAVHHRLTGQVVLAARAGRITLPEHVLASLRHAHRGAVARSAALRVELGRAAPLVEDACGAPPLLLKGPALADRFHPDPDLRPFADLDLLVPRGRLGAAASALLCGGWEELVEFAPGFGAEHGHDRHLRRGVGGAALDVELHWRIGDDPVCATLSHDELARVAAVLRVGTRAVLVPDVADQLLVAAVHLLSDRERRLGWVLDVALVARAADETAWQAAFARARRRGLAWALHRALDHADAYLQLRRPRPDGPAAPPPWGPLRMVDAFEAPVALHAGRLAALGPRERARYLRTVLLPDAEGLRGTVGHDGERRTGRLAARHVRRAVAGWRAGRS